MSPKQKQELENYPQLLQELKALLSKAKHQAYKAVDNIRVQTYWQVGERVVREELQHRDKAEYGQYLIKKLAEDLGFSKANLHNMVLFYRVYPIVQAVPRQLSWTHLVAIIYVHSGAEREFYEQQVIENAWSSRELERQIRANLYGRAMKKGRILIKKKLPLLPFEPEKVFKNTYHFDFLDLNKNYKEKDFKKALLDKLEKFLQELGPDFFVGRREVPILISGNYDKIDLELFHAGLLCYILVEIKIAEFQHKYVSQMYSYLNWYKQHKMQKGQRSPIGLIICKTKDEETVHYALGDLKKEIFVAEYITKLPTKEQIRKVLQ
ncbi:MAG: PDDEXK nuclease domain-containing protein [Nanoarchaeota archaeon]